MTSTMMKPLSKGARQVFDLLFSDMQPGQCRKIDNAPGAFMPVSLERHGDRFFTVTHYFVQEGDLVPDPDMVFWRAEDGRVFPVQFQQPSRFIRAVEFVRGAPELVRPHAQEDLVRFANLWMRNIKAQQGLRRGQPLPEAA